MLAKIKSPAPNGIRQYIFMSMCFVLIGCAQSDLDPDNAKEMIKNNPSWRKEYSNKMSFGTHESMSGSYKHLVKYANEYNQSGLFTVQILPSRNGKPPVKYWPTKDAEQYLRWLELPDYAKQHGERLAEATFYTCDFGKITGIAYLNQERTVARVEHTVLCERTPFAKKIPFSKWPAVENLNRTTISVQFRKYEDGWRIIR